MKCPKCQDVAMLAFTFHETEVDRCPRCGGVWLDKDELETILQRQLGTIIDMPTFSREASPADTKLGHCHRCDQDMIDLIGAAEVRFEWCDACEGMFFDRGELTIIQTFQAE